MNALTSVTKEINTTLTAARAAVGRNDMSDLALALDHYEEVLCILSTEDTSAENSKWEAEARNAVIALLPKPPVKQAGFITIKTLLLLVAVGYTATLLTEAASAASNTITQITAYAGGAR